MVIGSWPGTCIQYTRLHTNTTHENREWTNGRVENEKAFLSAFKLRMIERFKQERFTEISESERFSTYFSFK